MATKKYLDNTGGEHLAEVLEGRYLKSEVVNTIPAPASADAKKIYFKANAGGGYHGSVKLGSKMEEITGLVVEEVASADDLPTTGDERKLYILPGSGGDGKNYLEYEKSATVPSAATAKEGVVYLVPSDDGSYNEYMKFNNTIYNITGLTVVQVASTNDLPASGDPRKMYLIPATGVSSRYVDLSTQQTVGGIKTFIDSLSVADPTAQTGTTLNPDGTITNTTIFSDSGVSYPVVRTLRASGESTLLQVQNGGSLEASISIYSDLIGAGSYSAPGSIGGQFYMANSGTAYYNISPGLLYLRESTSSNDARLSLRATGLSIQNYNSGTANITFPTQSGQLALVSDLSTAIQDITLDGTTGKITVELVGLGNPQIHFLTGGNISGSWTNTDTTYTFTPVSANDTIENEWVVRL